MENNNNQVFYNCKKCSRITTGYPVGCYEKDCQVKKDFVNDIIWSIIIFLAMLGGIGLLGLSLIAQR